MSLSLFRADTHKLHKQASPGNLPSQLEILSTGQTYYEARISMLKTALNLFELPNMLTTGGQAAHATFLQYNTGCTTNQVGLH